jgi:hypothetical protein
MISTDEQLAQAIEQLGRMHHALAALKKEVLPLSESRFALLAEGPLDEIRKLEAAIDVYTGKAEAVRNDSDVWLQIVGPSLIWPEAPTSVLTAFLDALRKGVQALTEYLATGSLTARPTKDLKRACDLRVVAFQTGSLCVGVRVPDEAQLDLLEPNAHHPPVGKALKQYLQVANWIASDAPPEALNDIISEPQLRRIALNAVKPFVPRLRGDVESVAISGRAVGRAKAITLTRASHERIDRAIDVLETEKVEEHTGDLREIDLDGLSFILRNSQDVHEIRCSFEQDLLEIAKEALDRRVRVTGIRRVAEGRRTATTLRVTRLEILDEDASAPVAQTSGAKA